MIAKKRFYCTRGCKSGSIGTVHPIIANDENTARQYMFNTFGLDWCTSYTELQWLTWVARATVIGVPLEAVQPEVEV